MYEELLIKRKHFFFQARDFNTKFLAQGQEGAKFY